MSDITPELFVEICETVKAGVKTRTALGHADVPKTNFYDFMNADKRRKRRYVSARNWAKMTPAQQKEALRNAVRRKLDLAVELATPEEVKDALKGGDYVRMADMGTPATNVNVDNRQVHFHGQPAARVEFVEKGNVLDREAVIEAEYREILASGGELEPEDDDD